MQFFLTNVFKKKKNRRYYLLTDPRTLVIFFGDMIEVMFLFCFDEELPFY